MEPNLRLSRYLEERARAGLGVSSAVRLSGDASERSYYRLHLDSGSLVLALLPEPFDPDTLPFLNVAALFEKIPVRIPRIHHVSGRDGILLLEDLGDGLLQSLLESAGREVKRPIYREAVAILARLQQRGAELEDARYLPYRVAFDEAKLRWELDYFQKHFLEGLRQISLEAAEREVLACLWGALARELAGRPRVLCHRDYHARNLMLHEGELAVLDFQDARMGPATYDLVSLLRDSYVEHDPEFVEEMKESFCLAARGADVDGEFDPMSLQRNLKALGTFGYQISRRGKEVYRRYIPFTLALVRQTLARHPRWDGLRRVLGAHLPEIS